MQKTELCGKWNLSSEKITTTAQIPGDFHSALIKNKIIPDPYYGFNEKDVLWVGKTDWTISREFEFTKLQNAHSILEITQADTFFTVFINDKKVGNGQNQFARYRFDVTNFVKNGTNSIKILFESAEKKSAEIEKKLPYPIPYMKYDVYSPNRNLARKCQCHGGWDWGPCLMVSGIYGDICINQIADGLFNYAKINYDVDKNNNWKAKITFSYESFAEQEKNFITSIFGDDIEPQTQEKKFNLKKGENILSLTLNVKNPSVWKTSGELKEKNLKENKIYNLKIQTEDSSTKETSITKKICFNTLKAVSKKDKDEGKDGRSLYFENNGKKIFAKGSNWIPADSLPSRMTYERYEDLLKSAVESNQNCLRVWGGGIYENEDFYDLCDKLGIIIWQDCMFACSLYPTTKEFLSEVENELNYQVPRLQSHACIGLWCGNNENYGALGWFSESIKNRDRYIIDYDRLYNGTVGKKIKELDSNRLFWTSSPCSGPDEYEDNWHTDNKGDMHYWSVWHERKDKEAYMSIRPRFVSEFGYESFPSMECIKSFSPKEQWNFTSPLMEYHQRSPSGNSIILENFSRYFRFPSNFENMIYLSQVQQAVAIRCAVDWWRSLEPHCMGALFWQLNDVWPCPSWSSLEYNGKWKLLNYQAKRFFENIYMPLFVKDENLNAVFINDTEEDLKVSLKLQFLDFEGNEYAKTVEKTSQVSKNSIINLYKQTFDKKDANKYFVYATYSYQTKDGKIETKHTETFLTSYKHCDILEPNVLYKVLEKENGFEIKLSSSKPAFFVSLDADGIAGIFSDNMITLNGKDEVSITFSPKKNVKLEEFKKSLKVKNLRESY